MCVFFFIYLYREGLNGVPVEDEAGEIDVNVLTRLEYWIPRDAF